MRARARARSTPASVCTNGVLLLVERKEVTALRHTDLRCVLMRSDLLHPGPNIMRCGNCRELKISLFCDGTVSKLHPQHCSILLPVNLSPKEADVPPLGTRTQSRRSARGTAYSCNCEPEQSTMRSGNCFEHIYANGTVTKISKNLVR